ncbi:MAG: 1-deoxy-D-xylulose-5-phosphate reductoisomerase [Rhodospirillales bacterium CG15_BIG_FIL_POST_REV_8_21_14_020_66_15]|nr:MAG: 1-deoxy-D-xylulose-5-phosphate reductoisomerase [Rhodospirillales bacterium CG15_BIG_FIL_POST_REV_8_21_14_020_66_15]
MDLAIQTESTAADADEAPRSVTVLGATGSIGCNTVDILARHPAAFRAEVLTAHRNAPLLAEQAVRLGARRAVIGDAAKYGELKSALAGTAVEAAAGAEAIAEAGDQPADIVVAGIVGAAGLKPVLNAVRRGATVAFANKECLVSAGDLMVREVRAAGATLLPVDSEHSAIFQVFDFGQPDKVRRIVLTASGGPFRTKPRHELAAVTPAQAVAHPNWDMGAKISVDSATMMNKGLELIEAFHLFPVPEERIEILVHPQSVIHSMVDYVDGSVLAQLGTPDMRTPIAYALAWPRRVETPAQRLALEDIGTLTFEAPDPVRFPALRLAREALREGASAPTLLNAANEVAVAWFLERGLGFLKITEVVEKVLETVAARPLNSLDDVFAADAEARRAAEEIASKSVG